MEFARFHGAGGKRTENAFSFFQRRELPVHAVLPQHGNPTEELGLLRQPYVTQPKSFGTVPQQCNARPAQPPAEYTWHCE
ncbi:hypothetical protein [Streptomyces flavidovirens]|uniref:hypothetical protein n=1 Tax=Streptomyces flavidovirens TaxID=67298 RepID=UPI0036C116F0